MNRTSPAFDKVCATTMKYFDNWKANYLDDSPTNILATSSFCLCSCAFGDFDFINCNDFINKIKEIVKNNLYWLCDREEFMKYEYPKGKEWYEVVEKAIYAVEEGTIITSDKLESFLNVVCDKIYASYDTDIEISYN